MAVHASLDGIKNDIMVQSQITKVLNLYLATFLGKTKFYGGSAFCKLTLTQSFPTFHSSQHSHRPHHHSVNVLRQFESRRRDFIS